MKNKVKKELNPLGTSFDEVARLKQKKRISKTSF